MKLSFLVTGLAASGFENFDATDAKSGLDAHNYYRGLHGVPLLEWDDQLARDAQVHCDKMAENGQFEHADDLQTLGQGENLYTLMAGSADVALRFLNYTDSVKVESSTKSE